MARWFLLTSVVALAGCNVVLDIPERPLAPTGADATTDATGDVASDAPVDAPVDAPSDVQNADADGGAETSDAPLADAATDGAADLGTDAAVVDSGSDATVVDTGSDTASVDTGSDTTVVDTGSDTTVGDTGSVDTGSVDTGSVDTGSVDTGSDTGSVDTGSDTGSVDAGSDAGKTCGVLGKPCCGAVTKTTCDTATVCDTTTFTCVAASKACVRGTDCSSGEVCGGPSTCAGFLCFQCIKSFGTKAAFESCTSGAQCTSGVCDILRNTCTQTCANAITEDGDCAAMGPGVVCTELGVTSTAGGSTVSNRIGYCARKCESDAMCPSGQVCLNRTNEAMNREDIVCAPPRAGATQDFNGPCTKTGDCKSGLCLNTGSGAYCSRFCNAAADCTGTLSTCGLVTIGLPDGVGKQAAYACQ